MDKPIALDFFDALESAGDGYKRSKLLTQAVLGSYKLRVAQGRCAVMTEVPNATGRESNRIDVFVKRGMWIG